MDLQEQKINIRGVDINYLEIGNGEHPILLIPGTLGSLWLAFQPQIERLDKTKFTIVAWDPPGCGKSIPPNRTMSEDFLETDATFANDLMQALGHKTFSTIGFCGGGRVAVVLAAIYPDSVRRLIVTSTNTCLSPEEMTTYEHVKDVDNWPELYLKPMLELYGYDYFKSVWWSWIDMLLKICKKQNGDICSNFLDHIRCQTLIVQGAKDELVNQTHAAFLNARIRHSRVHIFENGRHHLHLKFADEFNDLATNFLLSSE